MKTILVLVDDLIRVARRLTGITDADVLIGEALKVLIERESAQKLAELGGTMPKLKSIRRRRPGLNKFFPVGRSLRV